MEHFLHLLNAKPPFMSWQRSAFQKIDNDWIISWQIFDQFSRKLKRICWKMIWPKQFFFTNHDNLGPSYHYIHHSKLGLLAVSVNSVVSNGCMSKGWEQQCINVNGMLFILWVACLKIPQKWNSYIFWQLHLL